MTVKEKKEKQRENEKYLDELIAKGYTMPQINIILLSPDYEWLEVKPELPIKHFKLLNTVASKAAVSKATFIAFNDYLKELPFDKLNNNYEAIIENIETLINFAYDLDDNISLFAQYANHVNENKVLEILQTANDFSNKMLCLNLLENYSVEGFAPICAGLFDEANKISSSNSIYTRKALDEITSIIALRKDIPLSVLKDFTTEDKLKDLRKYLEENKEIDMSFFEVTSDYKRFALASFLKENGCDTKKILECPQNEYEEYKSIYSHVSDKYSSEKPEEKEKYKNQLIKLYNANLSGPDFTLAITCAKMNADYEKVLSFPGSAESKYRILELKNHHRNVYDSETLEYLLKNSDVYTKKDLESFEMLANVLSTRVFVESYVKDIANINYDENQRRVLVKGVAKDVELTRYCTPEYMPSQMEVILRARAEKRAVSDILNPSLTPKQMEAILFYHSIGKTFDTPEKYEENFLEDSTNYYAEFFNNFYNLFPTQEAYQKKRHYISILTDYNYHNEDKFNIDATASLMAQYNIDIDVFAKFLELKKVAVDFINDHYTDVDFNEKFKQFLIENGIEENMYMGSKRHLSKTQIYYEFNGNPYDDFDDFYL